MKLIKASKAFGRNMFGRPRTLSEKASRLVRGKNPFTPKVTVGSVVGRPVGRLVTATVVEGADALVLGTIGAAVGGLIGLARNLFSSKKEEVQQVASEVEETAAGVDETLRRASGR